jgi:hypothetical protein
VAEVVILDATGLVAIEVAFIEPFHEAEGPRDKAEVAWGVTEGEDALDLGEDCARLVMIEDGSELKLRR